MVNELKIFEDNLFKIMANKNSDMMEAMIKFPNWLFEIGLKEKNNLGIYFSMMEISDFSIDSSFSKECATLNISYNEIKETSPEFKTIINNLYEDYVEDYICKPIDDTIEHNIIYDPKLKGFIFETSFKKKFYNWIPLATNIKNKSYSFSKKYKTFWEYFYKINCTNNEFEIDIKLILFEDYAKFVTQKSLNSKLDIYIISKLLKNTIKNFFSGKSEYISSITPDVIDDIEFKPEHEKSYGVYTLISQQMIYIPQINKNFDKIVEKFFNFEEYVKSSYNVIKKAYDKEYLKDNSINFKEYFRDKGLKVINIDKFKEFTDSEIVITNLFNEMYLNKDSNFDKIFEKWYGNRNNVSTFVRMDWGSENMIFWEGTKLVYYDVSGLKPLTNFNKYLNFSLSLSYVLNTINFEEIKENLKVSNLKDYFLDKLKASGIYGNGNGIYTTIRDLHQNSKNDVKAKKTLELFIEVLKEVIVIINKVSSLTFGKCKALAWAYLCYNDIKNIDNIIKSINDTFDINNKKDIDIPALPLIKEGLSLMPHQSETLTRLSKIDDISGGVLSIEPGGGKTIISILDIIDKLNKNIINRPIIITKDSIINDWVNEIKRISDFNYIIFTTETFNNWGEEKLNSLVNNAPTNTIYLTTYSFLGGDRGDIKPYINDFIKYFPKAFFLKKLKFDYVGLDESQNIKNPGTNTFKAVSSIASNAKFTRLISGTIVHDNPLDLVGQYALIDPSFFGTKEAFIGHYAKQVVRGIPKEWDEKELERISIILQHGVTMNKYDKSSWVYFLPNMIEKIHVVEMTEPQKKIYNSIYKSIIEELLKDEEFRKIIEEYKRSGDEQLENSIVASMRTKFHRLEIFTSAHDKDEVASKLLKGNDLISSKIKKVDELIDEHFNSGNEGKIIIFGYHINAVTSVYENSKHKSKMILYTAGAKEAINQFKNNDKIKIIVAAEKSIKEGINLQMASRMIRIETMWSPGDMDQALSRMFRPDVIGTYNRPNIYFDWIVTNNTIDIPKMGRVIYKTIINAKLDDKKLKTPVDDIESYRNVPTPEKILFIPSEMEKFSDMSNILYHINCYNDYKKVEKQFFKESKEEYKNVIFDNVRPAKPNFKFGTLKNVPIVSTMDSIPGEEDDIFDFERIDTLGTELKKDDIIKSEFGWGKIIGVRISKKTNKQSSFKVKILEGEFKDQEFNISKSRIFIPTKDKEKVSETIEKLSKIKNKIQEEKIKEDKELIPEVNKIEDNKINLYLNKVNGLYALSIGKDDPDSKLFSKFGFKYAGNFMFYKVKNRSMAHSLIEIIKSKYRVNNQQVNLIEDMIDKTKNGIFKGKISPNSMKNFLKISHRKKEKGTVYIYPILFEEYLYIVADIKSQPWVKKLNNLKIKGWEEDNGAWWYYSSNKLKIKSVYNKIKKQFVIENKKEFESYLKEL